MWIFAVQNKQKERIGLRKMTEAVAKFVDNFPKLIRLGLYILRRSDQILLNWANFSRPIEFELWIGFGSSIIS